MYKPITVQLSPATRKGVEAMKCLARFAEKYTEYLTATRGDETALAEFEAAWQDFYLYCAASLKEGMITEMADSDFTRV